nr:autotransporter outer membrane beta-barrel domain-containing protein [Dyella acidiphila]
MLTDFGAGSLAIGSGSSIDLAASWGSFSPGSVPAYSYRTLQIGSSDAHGASVQLADGAAFTLLSDIRNGQADKIVFTSGISSFAASGTLGIRIAYDPVLDATSWVNATALQKGVAIAASTPIVIADAGAAAGGTAQFQAVQGLTGQWKATYENALVQFSYTPQVSLSTDRKQVLLTGIDILGNNSGASGSTAASGTGSNSTSTGSTSTGSTSTGNTTSATGGSAGTGSSGSQAGTTVASSTKHLNTADVGVVPANGAAVMTPATGVMVAADTARALANAWQLDDAAVDRRSESLRLDQDDTAAVWTDAGGGELHGDGEDGRYRQSTTTASIGADRRSNYDGGTNTTGLVYTHDQSRAEVPNGSAELRGDSLGLYSSWVSAGGVFADLVARAGHWRSSYVATDAFGTAAARYRSPSASLSLRVGRRLRNQRGGYIEPQLQAAYGSVGHSSYRASNDVRFDVRQNHSFLSRAGLLAGQTLPGTGTVAADVYARAAVVHVVGASPDLTASLDGGTLPVLLPARHATTAEAAAGVQVALPGHWRVFAEAGHSSSGDTLPGGWRASAGVRVSF